MDADYKFRFLDAEQQADIAKQVTAVPAPVVPDDSLRTAWEADLAGHMALLDAATDDDTRQVHAKAIATLREALGG